MKIQALILVVGAVLMLGGTAANAVTVRGDAVSAMPSGTAFVANDPLRGQHITQIGRSHSAATQALVESGRLDRAHPSSLRSRDLWLYSRGSGILAQLASALAQAFR